MSEIRIKKTFQIGENIFDLTDFSNMLIRKTFNRISQFLLKNFLQKWFLLVKEEYNQHDFSDTTRLG